MPVSENFPVRLSMLPAGVVTAVLVLGVLIPDKGEVVRLITHDTVGQPLDTELWIADLPAGAYLRAGNSNVKWRARLSSGGAASLERNGESVLIETFVVEDAKTLAAVDRAMAEKYGAADRMWGVIRSDDLVVIRVNSLGDVTATAQQTPHGIPHRAQDIP